MRAVAAVAWLALGCGRIGFDPSGCPDVVGPEPDPVVTGPTYYVAPLGDDARSCTQAMSPDMPRKTIRRSFECIQSGDRLVLRGGTYTEEISTYLSTIRGGTSWETATRVSAYPGEIPVVMPAVGSNRCLTLAKPEASWMIFEGIVFDATNINTTFDTALKITYELDPAVNAHHVRLVGGEIRNAPGSAFTAADPTARSELIGVDVHDNSLLRLAPAVEVGSDGLVERCRIHHNGGRSVEVYNDTVRVTGVRIRYNQIHDNVEDVYIASSDETEVYRNVIWRNGGGIKVEAFTPSGTRIWNNTLVGNVGVETFCVDVAPGSVTTDIRNNICFGNGPEIVDNGTGTVIAGNLLADPSFVDAASNDFNLRVSSTALDAGLLLPGIAFAGTAPDIGAFEAPIATSFDRCDATSVSVAFETAFPPLRAPSGCGGFAIRDGSRTVPIVDCRSNGSAIQFDLGADASSSTVLDYSGDEITDSAAFGGTSHGRLHAFIGLRVR